jgi:hypothetical protein
MKDFTDKEILQLFRTNCVHYAGNYEISTGQAIAIAWKINIFARNECNPQIKLVDNNVAELKPIEEVFNLDITDDYTRMFVRCDYWMRKAIALSKRTSERTSESFEFRAQIDTLKKGNSGLLKFIEAANKSITDLQNANNNSAEENMKLRKEVAELQLKPTIEIKHRNQLDTLNLQIFALENKVHSLNYEKAPPVIPYDTIETWTTDAQKDHHMDPRGAARFAINTVINFYKAHYRA